MGPCEVSVKTEHSQTDINMDVVQTKPHEIIRLESLVPSNFDEQVSAIMKPQVLPNAQSNQRSTVSSIKQEEKKRLSNGQHAAILKRVNKIPPIYPSTCRKSTLRTKDNPPKRVIKVPVKANAEASLVSGVYNRRPLEKPKTVSKSKETKPVVAELLKVKEISSEKAPTLNEVTSSNLLPENVQTDNIIVNKEIDVVSNLYSNQNSEIPSIVVDADGNPIALYKIDIIEKGETVEESKLSEPVHIQIPASANEVIQTKNMAEDKSNSNIKIVDVAKQPEPSRNNILLINKPANDQYVAIVNKGDIVNLKLKIEITSGDDMVSPRNIKRSQHQKSHSYSTSIIKTEKGSQVNIEDEIFLESKSLHSILATESPHNYGIEGNSKILVVQCTCCDQYKSTPMIGTAPIYCDGKKYVILVPSVSNEDQPVSVIRNNIKHLRKKSKSLNQSK